MNFEKIIDAYIASLPPRKALNQKEFNNLVHEISSFRRFKKLSKEISQYLLQKFYTADQDLFIFKNSHIEIVDIIYAYAKYSHFSHQSALMLHGLSLIENNEIYISEDSSISSTSKNNLTQEKIDLAFSKAQRITTNTKQFKDKTIFFLKNQSSPAMETFINGVKVSNAEKTLIDCVVRPKYSGGTTNILNAFAMAKSIIDPDKLYHHYRKLSFIYPYNQAIGFYLENAGYDEKSYRKFQKMKRYFDFYLDYKLSAAKYCKKWKIHYNEDTVLY